MSLTVEARVGKKYALYLPKVVVKALSLKEGDKILLSVAGTTVTLQTLQDPIQLALSGKKFASVTPEEVEAISIEEQGGNVTSSA